MNISNAKATYGLNARGVPKSVSVTGSVQIGDASISRDLVGADAAYAVRIIFAQATNEALISLDTSTLNFATAFSQGFQQIETATAVGTVTAAGNASIVVTAAGMTGSPLTIPVPVALSDTPTLWAAKVRSALSSNAAVSLLLAISGTGTSIILTRKPTYTFNVPTGSLYHYAANDATLNLAISTGTATGITAAPTSINTQSGTATDGVRSYNHGADFEGKAIPTIVNMQSVCIQNQGASAIAVSAGNSFSIAAGGVNMAVGHTGNYSPTYTASGPTDMIITVIGSTI